MASSVRSIRKKQFRLAQDLNAPVGSVHNNGNGLQICRPTNHQSCDSVARRAEIVDQIHDGRIECLVSSPLFCGLSADQYRQIGRAAEEISYSPQQVIFLQDEPVRRVMVVASGVVRIIRVTEEGKQILLRLERSRAWVGDTVASHQLQSACARANDATVLLGWDVGVFEDLMNRIPSIERNVVGITRHRLQALQERLCDLSTLRVPRRLARLMLQLAKETENPSCLSALSREDIAQMAGTTLFMVSRLLSSWAESDIVTLGRGTVVIKDSERLQELAEAA